MSVQDLVNEYNQAEAQQTERRRAILAALAAAGPGHRTVLFAGGQQLSDHLLGEPTAVNSFIDRLANPIVRVEGA